MLRQVFRHDSFRGKQEVRGLLGESCKFVPVCRSGRFLLGVEGRGRKRLFARPNLETLQALAGATPAVEAERGKGVGGTAAHLLLRATHRFMRA